MIRYSNCGLVAASRNALSVWLPVDGQRTVWGNCVVARTTWCRKIRSRNGGYIVSYQVKVFKTLISCKVLLSVLRREVRRMSGFVRKEGSLRFWAASLNRISLKTRCATSFASTDSVSFRLGKLDQFQKCAASICFSMPTHKTFDGRVEPVDKELNLLA